MLKHSLKKTGLSMSQAQTISNLANQIANDKYALLLMANNYSKTVDFKGKLIVQEEARALPETAKDDLDNIGQYRALQAFLMEQIKAKEALLKSIRDRQFESKVKAPVPPNKLPYVTLPAVTEAWGWEQLAVSQLSEFWEAEAKAAVLGKFIHNNGKLDLLRKELPHVETLQWFTEPGYQGASHPVTVLKHHTQEQLSTLHQALANQHRELEQKVNYFKAMVKNLTSEENQRIAAENGTKAAQVNEENIKLLNEHRVVIDKYNGEVTVEMTEFEKTRQNDLREAAALRIEVPSRFQKKVDELMPKGDVSDEDTGRKAE